MELTKERSPSKASGDRQAWSRSQMSAFRECRRKYFFNTQSVQNPESHPLLSKSIRLKKLINRYLWTGSLVHDAVGELLKTARQGTELPVLEEMLSGVREKMREEFKTSKESLSLLEAGSTGRRLFEHEYGFELSPQEWRRQWELVETSLRWFYQSKWLERLKALGPECWKAVDEIVEFDVNGVKTYGKIDCAVETEGRFTLLDWKTTPASFGQQHTELRGPSSSNISLHIAALYAHDVWGADPAAIQAMTVSLRDGTTSRVEVNEETLMETQVRIEEEALELQEFLTTSETNPLNIPGITNPIVCDRCSYKKLCY